MTVHAEAHGVIDVALGHGPFRHVAVTGGALDFGADMRRMVEPHVVFRRKSIDPLPRYVESLVSHGGHLLNTRTVGGNRVMADHAGPEARYPCARAFVDAFMAELAGNLFTDVHVVRKVERLLVYGAAIEKVVNRGGHGRPRGSEHACRLAWQNRQRGCCRRPRLFHELTRHAGSQRREAHGEYDEEACVRAQVCRPRVSALRFSDRGYADSSRCATC